MGIIIPQGMSRLLDLRGANVSCTTQPAPHMPGRSQLLCEAAPGALQQGQTVHPRSTSATRKPCQARALSPLTKMALHAGRVCCTCWKHTRQPAPVWHCIAGLNSCMAGTSPDDAPLHSPQRTPDRQVCRGVGRRLRQDPADALHLRRAQRACDAS